jgi:hypothetical protein
MEDEGMDRRSEKIGWIGGWLGGFIWVVLLSAVWIVQNKISNGALGIILFTVAVILIFRFAPWKHPDTKYWKLMLPIYLQFFISIALSIYLYGGLKIVGLNWMSFFWLIPCFIPFVTMGNRKWNIDA